MAAVNSIGLPDSLEFRDLDQIPLPQSKSRLKKVMMERGRIALG